MRRYCLIEQRLYPEEQLELVLGLSPAVPAFVLTVPVTTDSSCIEIAAQLLSKKRSDLQSLLPSQEEIAQRVERLLRLESPAHCTAVRLRLFSLPEFKVVIDLIRSPQV